MTTKDRTRGAVLTTSNIDVYVVPPRHSTSVESLVITNGSAGNVLVSLDWHDSANNVYYSLAKDLLVYGRSMVQIEHALTLQANDKIRGLASVDAVITVSTKVYELYTPSLTT